MPHNNEILRKASKARNDEFYTTLEDIEKEILTYFKDCFTDKIVYCNCDDPYRSNFFKFFVYNFNVLGLKKLIATCYSAQLNSTTPASLFESDFDNISSADDKDTNSTAYKAEVTIVGDVTDVNSLFSVEGNSISMLNGDGDFRSQECIELLKGANIVVTNPPFSLFEEFVNQLVKYDKQFIILGNSNAIPYRDIFPLIRSNKMSIAYTDKTTMWFIVPNDFADKIEKDYVEKDGIVYMSVNGVRWFTNINNCNKEIPFIPLTKKYSPDTYLKFDKHNAINVDKVADIPCDYYGVMGVPITFLDRYNPNQFEIVSFRNDSNGNELVFSATEEDIFNDTLLSPYDDKNDTVLQTMRQVDYNIHCDKYILPIDYFYPSALPVDGCITCPRDTIVNGVKKYVRILIRRKINCC